MDDNFEIFLDTIVFRIQTFGGASTYWKELVSNFIKLDTVTILIQSADTDKLNSDGRSILRFTNKKGNFLIENLLPVKILRYLPLTVRLPAGALYHGSYYRTCLQKDVVNIFTVHDFTHKKGYASKFPRKLVHIGLTAVGLKNADGIICISENTKKDLMYFYPQISEDRVRVIYHGVSHDFYPVAKTNDQYFKGKFILGQNFVIFVGKRGGYKKFNIVAEALSKMNDMALVVIGGGALSPSEEKYLNDHLANRYYKFDNLTNEELNILYNHAFSMIYPSIYEGFGIPIAEAMRAGCPVITNKLSSIPEVAGDAALFISEISADSIINEIYLLKDAQLRTALIQRGFVQSSRFTWERCFLETFEFYKEIYKAKLVKN